VDINKYSLYSVRYRMYLELSAGPEISCFWVSRKLVALFSKAGWITSSKFSYHYSEFHIYYFYWVPTEENYKYRGFQKRLT